jgi:hypothetical protein
VKQAEDAKNELVLVRLPSTQTLDYWAGFAWDRAGRITSDAAWQRYVTQFAQGVRTPIAVSVSER